MAILAFLGGDDQYRFLCRHIFWSLGGGSGGGLRSKDIRGNSFGRDYWIVDRHRARDCAAVEFKLAGRVTRFVSIDGILLIAESIRP